MKQTERKIRTVGNPNPSLLPKEQRDSFLDALYAAISALYRPSDGSENRESCRPD